MNLLFYQLNLFKKKRLKINIFLYNAETHQGKIYNQNEIFDCESQASVGYFYNPQARLLI